MAHVSRCFCKVTPVFDLENEASSFATKISELLNATVAHDAELSISNIDNTSSWITSGPIPNKKSLIPLVTGPTVRGIPMLGLSIFYKLTQVESNEHLSVLSSGISLVMNSDSKNPVIRLEFERNQGIEPGAESTRSHRRHAAHVQIHGESSALGAIWALNGRVHQTKLESLHIPVGGRRFRPSLEDFIEFLVIENLISALHENGQQTLDRSRNEWLEIQLKAAVRSNPAVAIDQLRKLNYTILKSEA